MSIYAISDLHLSFNEDKPMDVFGDKWEDHEKKIKKDWEEKVKEEDLVLLPGDFSWSMQLENTYKDFEYLNKLPGNKLILKGNHDYWWTTLTKMRKYLKENKFNTIDFIYNNSYVYENNIICGTRGWIFSNLEENSKIINREIKRLELSLQDGIKKYGEEKEIIVCMHYPPISNLNNMNKNETQIMELMKSLHVKKCIYGHLHGPAHKNGVEGMIQDIEFTMVSCDYTDFKLIKLI